MPGDLELTCAPCAPQEPGERLQMALEKRDLAGFTAALTDVTPEDPLCTACLHQATADPTYFEYLQKMLVAGVDPNTPNGQGKMPLQTAAENNFVNILRILLKDKRTDVNILNNFGNTALHLVVEGQGSSEDQAQCVSMLLALPQMDRNKKNRKGHSAVLLAAKKSSQVVVQAFLKDRDIDLDHAKFLNGNTARSLIETNYPELQSQLAAPLNNSSTSLGDDLMRLLYEGSKEALIQFCELVKDASPDQLDYHDGNDTLLQRACTDGRLEALRALLKNGADPNKTAPGTGHSLRPLMRACAAGHSHIVRVLLDNDGTRANETTTEGDTALIQLVRYWNMFEGEYMECLQLLLKHDIDINASNKTGETALRYASMTGDHQLVLALLKAGAYIGGTNMMNRLPLTNIPRDVFEAHLNDCITNHQSHFSENYRIEFDYRCLVPPGRVAPSKGAKPLNSKSKDCEAGESEETEGNDEPESFLGSCPETEPLLFMTRKSDLRPLLKHPVLTSFMELKWQRLALLFKLNIIFYIFFVAFITVHILWGNGRGVKGVQTSSEADAPATPVNNPGFECREWAPISNASNSNNNVTAELSENRRAFNDGVQVVSVILLIILALRELFQFVVSPCRYFSWSNKENYFELLLLVSTSLILFRNDLQPYFSAITILLSWGELVLLVGRHPMLSTYIEMLKTVSWNFLKFLAWYAILIVAFALSFYTLFRDSDEAGNFFVDPGLSVFKTVVMLTGEFDASDIPFVEFPVISHVVFVMFVFLIAIVLFNLLNGLAVSDTQAIKNDAELVGYVSRVKLVAYIERMVLGHRKNSWWSSVLQWPVLARRVTLLRDTENVAGHVLPNQGAAIWVGPRDEKRDEPPPHVSTLQYTIIKAAEEVLEMKDRPSDMDQVKSRLVAMDQLLHKLMAKLDREQT